MAKIIEIWKVYRMQITYCNMYEIIELKLMYLDLWIKVIKLVCFLNLKVTIFETQNILTSSFVFEHSYLYFQTFDGAHKKKIKTILQHYLNQNYINYPDFKYEKQILDMLWER